MQHNDRATRTTAARVSRRGLLAGAGAGAALLGTAAPAAAAPARSGRSAAEIVDVVGRADGIDLRRNRVPAGVVRFDITAAAGATPSVGVIRLRAGVSVETYLTHYLLATDPDPVTRRRAVQLIDSEAFYFGGGSTGGSARVSWTTVLTPGDYHLLNWSAAATGGFRDGVRKLTVTAPVTAPAALPPTDGTVAAYDEGYQGRYLVAPELPGSAALTVWNQTGQLNEAVFWGLQPGKTAADVQVFFDAARNGTPPPPWPFSSGPYGATPLSPGASGISHLTLPPGDYIVTSFISNRRTSVKRAFEGMWSLVTVR